MTYSKMDKYFGSVGIGFPENEEQLQQFNELHVNYQFKGNKDAIDPVDILKSIKSEQKKVTNIDYHKRIVLAAEIVFQLNKEYTMGHLKLQKIIYLCENITTMSLHTNFLKQAMGPYDPSMMRSIDKQLKKNNWYIFTPNNFPLYKPLQNAGGHKVWYERYFSDQSSDINFLINTFRKSKSEKVELVATLYACWLEAIEKKMIISNALLIKMVYEWSKIKEKFSESTIQLAIEWMNETGIKPKLINDNNL